MGTFTTIWLLELLYAGLLEFNVNLERKQELFAMVQEEVLPTLKKGPGCLAIVPFSVEDKPEKMYVISLRQSKQHWESRCDHTSFAKIKEQMAPYLTTPINVERCVAETTLCEDFVKATNVSAATRTIAEIQEELNGVLSALIDN